MAQFGHFSTIILGSFRFSCPLAFLGRKATVISISSGLDPRRIKKYSTQETAKELLKKRK